MKQLKEGFEVQDLESILKPWIHVDEYKSKLGKDDRNCVVSFTIDDKAAAQDLVDFLERGYDFILDADLSSNEISRNRYLVFAEIRRLTTLYDNIEKILQDLQAASGINPKTGWKFAFMKEKTYQLFNKENFNKIVPLTARMYRKRFVKPVQDLKSAAGLNISTDKTQDKELKGLQSLAGIS